MANGKRQMAKGKRQMAKGNDNQPVTIKITSINFARLLIKNLCTNQPINQSTNQPINQSTNQLINQSTNNQ